MKVKTNLLCNGTILLLIYAIFTPTRSADWGYAKLDSLKQGVVVLENNKLLVRYKRHVTDFRCNFIKDLISKDVNEDQAVESYGLDEIYHGQDGSGFLAKATVIHDGPDSISVLFKWSNGKTIQRVTMFPNSTILKLRYIKVGTGICDIGPPGKIEQKQNKNQYIFYGGEKWHKAYVRCPLGYYYRPAPHDFGMTGWKGNGPGDPDSSPLNYKGYFIMGVYNQDNNRGFGRMCRSVF